jgi:hypothetical protein
MLPLTYCRKTVVKGGMVSHVGYHDTISVRPFYRVLFQHYLEESQPVPIEGHPCK